MYCDDTDQERVKFSQLMFTETIFFAGNKGIEQQHNEELSNNAIVQTPQKCSLQRATSD